MEGERDLLGQVLVKMALQIGSLIDVCEGQQKIITNLTERVEKLEGAAPKAKFKEKTEVDKDYLERLENYYNRYRNDGWGHCKG